MRVNMTHNENTAGVQMKNVGFIRKADSPGRIVIPKEICKIPGFDADSLSFVHWQDRQLIFEEYQKTCTFCGACPTLKFDTKILCGADCYADLRLHIEAQKESRGNSSK